MTTSNFRWSIPLSIAAFILSHTTTPLLPKSASGSVGWGVAYFEPPRSIGTPIEDIVRAYTGFGLAAKIEGRLRLETDASLNPVIRELIRRRLAQRS
jgi:hypothetical protein